MFSPQTGLVAEISRSWQCSTEACLGATPASFLGLPFICTDTLTLPLSFPFLRSQVILLFQNILKKNLNF